MSSLEARREEFRKYLERNGVIDSLTKALIKLYEEKDKPEDAVRFVRQYMCEDCPTEKDFIALKSQLENAQNTIVALEKELETLKGMATEGVKVDHQTPSESKMLLESDFEKLRTDENCKSLLKKHLTPEIFAELQTLKTSFGSTIRDCIQSGLDNHDSNIGVYAPDAQAYTIFAKLYDPIIEEYHKGFTNEQKHPETDWGDASTLENLDVDKQFIVSTRVRCGRSLKEFPFNPRMTADKYTALMEKVRSVFETFDDDDELKGTFYPLEGMDKDLQQNLIDEHFLFKEGDRFLKSAGATQFWPIGRGIFFNNAKTFLIWVNEEDHLRFISMQSDGNLGEIYQRLVKGVEHCSKKLEFSHDERLGWLTFCPTNLGTTIRASVHIRLPKLSADTTKLNEIAAQYNLQVRGTHGEHTESESGVYDISNKRRLGLTEYEAVKEMHTGISEMIKMEKEME